MELKKAIDFLKAALSIAQTDAVNATARSGGAVGGNAVVPKVVRRMASQGNSILDFGAGKAASQAKSLKSSGYNVTAYEIGDNFVEGLHDKGALGKKYDVVYASNVLNVLPSRDTVSTVLGQLKSAMKPNGFVIANYPSSPRKWSDSTDEMEKLVQSKFAGVEDVGSDGNKVWKLSNNKTEKKEEVEKAGDWHGNLTKAVSQNVWH